MAVQISLDHLEHVAAQAWKEHEDVLKLKRDSYYQCFLDSRWEMAEEQRERAERKAKKTAELLAAEAAAEANEQ